MTCYHPIKAFIVNEPNRKFAFADLDTEYVMSEGIKKREYKLLPCGKCIGCRVDRSREWANRIMLELKYNEKACFVTLTYNDDYVPYCEGVDENGELVETDVMTLRKDHLQKFMKRLRKQIAPAKVRYFACGEYGELHHRPHYHVILFGYDFPDKYPDLEHSKDGYVVYRSPLLEKIWTDPDTHESRGFSLIAEVNWNTAAYVARYCTKKYTPLRNIYYQTFMNEPEFQVMSRRPGIGRQYYDDHKEEVYINQEIFLQNMHGGMKVPPPKYYDRLYKDDNPLDMEQIKEFRRKVAEDEQALKLAQTDLSLKEQLLVDEKAFKDRIASLRRIKA